MKVAVLLAVLGLAPTTGAVDLGQRWTATLTYPGRPPALAAVQGSRTRPFTLTRVRNGVYRASITLDAVGTWTIRGRTAGRTRRLGALTVRPALTNAVDVVLLPDGRLLVPDLANYVYAAPAGGVLSVLAGNGRAGSSGDGGAATAAAVGFPTEVAVDPAGGFAVVQGNRVRHIAPDGTITTIGTFEAPTALVYDAERTLYVSELGGRVLRVDAVGTTTYAAGLAQPHGLGVDAGGNLFVCDVGNHRIVRVDRGTGALSTVAGGLGVPVDLTVAPDGSLYVADFGDNRIVRIAGGAPTEVVTGTGPNSVAVDASGVVYFTERTKPHVLRLDPASGRVTVALGR
jgi:NHL repeat-containing protein